MVDAAPVPEGIDDLLARPALSPEATASVLAHADPGLDARCRDAGWPPPLVQVFWPGMPQELEEQLTSSGPVRTNPADEIHHVVDGAVMCESVLRDQSQGHCRGATW